MPLPVGLTPGRGNVRICGRPAVRVSRNTRRGVGPRRTLGAIVPDLRSRLEDVGSSGISTSPTWRVRISRPHPHGMKISVPTEVVPRELRVAITPDSVARLIKQQKLEVAIQSGAGLRAGFRDDAYAAAGASIAPDAASLYSSATAVAKVQPPTPEEIGRIPQGITLISLMRPGQSADIVGALAQRKITSLALELVPRITRAQSMDVLSSQSTVAGYKGVLIGAAALPKFLPMLTTAAGNITPAKVFVIGAGVAGLQAIATARRLGGVVSAFDVRPAAREQVLSLGASFVQSDAVSDSAQTAGGYAREQTEEERTRTLEAMANHIKDQDLV